MLGLFNLNPILRSTRRGHTHSSVCLFRTVIAGWRKIPAFVTECWRIRRSDFRLEDAEFTANHYDRDTRYCTYNATTRFPLVFARTSLILGGVFFFILRSRVSTDDAQSHGAQ